MGLARRPEKRRLAILKAGDPPRALTAYGTYPDMFRKLLGEDRYDYIVFDAERGDLPSHFGQCPAYLITGSASDAHGTSPWVSALKQFLNAAKGKAALVGVCFGHQVMAEAFGGRVAKSPNGWGLGSHSYDIVRPQPWSGQQTRITLPASHQDQVVELPPASEVVAANSFSPFGFIAYQDQRHFAQLHPEFEADFAIALVGEQPAWPGHERRVHKPRYFQPAATERPRPRSSWINHFLKAQT